MLVNLVERICGHTWMILRHKYWVFRFCCIAGIPWQGFMHDWSKFSPMEFVESVKYYNGRVSPIKICKQKNNGLSIAWIHHHGRNLHHYEAWWDNFDHGAYPQDMPYKYAVELICDCLGAGKAYGRDKFTFQAEYEWWQNKCATGIGMSPNMQEFVETILSQLAKTEDLSLLRPESTQTIYNKTVKEGKNEHPDFRHQEV